MQKRKHARQGKQKPKKKQSGFKGENNVRVVKVGHVVPEEVDTQLTWVYQGDLSGPAPQVSTYFHTNDVYDVDPAIGGTSAVGFNEWSSFYSNFRVTGYIINLEITNLQDFPVSLFLIDSTIANPSPGLAQSLSGGPNGRSYILGPKGSTQATRRVRYSKRIADVVGSKAPLTADNFMGTTDGTLRVVDHTYINLGINSMTGANLSLGVAYLWRISHFTKFYGRKLV